MKILSITAPVQFRRCDGLTHNAFGPNLYKPETHISKTDFSPPQNLSLRTVIKVCGVESGRRHTVNMF